MYAVVLDSPLEYSLDDCIEYIQEDELVEVTPKSVRMCKNPKFKKTRQNSVTGCIPGWLLILEECPRGTSIILYESSLMHQQSVQLILFDIQILQQVLLPGLVNLYSIDPAKLYNIAQKIENSCIMRAKVSLISSAFFMNGTGIIHFFFTELSIYTKRKSKLNLGDLRMCVDVFTVFRKLLLLFITSCQLLSFPECRV